MFFSIIIPLYNKEKFIVKTLSQVCEQTYKDFEVLVINDGSKDNSVTKVKEFKDERIKIYSKENGGVSSARNYGIEKAKGKYIAFLDADDWWDKNYLLRMYSVISENSDAEVFCCCNAEVDGKGNIKINPIYRYLYCNESQLDYQEAYLKTMESPIHTSAVIVKREILAMIKFNENISMGEDILLWLQLSLNSKIIITKEILSFYNRADENSATSSLAPLNKTFIPLLSELNCRDDEYINHFLLTRIILNMIRPYYIYNFNEVIDSIVKKCNMKYATTSQKIQYYLPRKLLSILYKILK